MSNVPFRLPDVDYCVKGLYLAFCFVRETQLPNVKSEIFCMVSVLYLVRKVTESGKPGVSCVMEQVMLWGKFSDHVEKKKYILKVKVKY